MKGGYQKQRVLTPLTSPYRARTYDPRLARFLQRDPIGYRGGINLHEYVGGHSLYKNDPSGLAWGLATGLPGAGIGAGVGGIVSACANAWYYNPDRTWAEYASTVGTDTAIGAAGGYTVGSLLVLDPTPLAIGSAFGGGLVAGGLIGLKDTPAYATPVETVGNVLVQADETASLSLVLAPVVSLGGTAIGKLKPPSGFFLDPPANPSALQLRPEYLKSFCPCPKNPIPDKLRFPLCGPGTLGRTEQAEIESIIKDFDTTVDVVGSRGAGNGRNVDTNFPVGKDVPGGPPTRSDIDFRVDGDHPRIDSLIFRLERVGNGAGNASIKHNLNDRSTWPPFIRFCPPGK